MPEKTSSSNQADINQDHPEESVAGGTESVASNRGGNGNRVSVDTLAAAITADHHFAKDEPGSIFVYRDGCYQSDGEDFVKLRAKKLCLEWGEARRWSSGLCREVSRFIAVDAPKLWEIPPLDEINLRNGLLDIRTRHLRAHSADFFSPVQIPVNYDPDAKCVAWNEFVEGVFPDDAKELAWEIAGDLLVPDRSIQKAVLLSGPGGNGKSTFLVGLQAFVGPENVSGESLHSLAENRFAPAQLQGRLANICADLPSPNLNDSSVFKSITGGDSIRAERKYGPPFSFPPHCRLLFSSNSLPIAKDSSQAYLDRWIIVPFEKRFRGEAGEVPRSVLDKQLADPKELSGLLNLALDGLDRLRRTGRFSQSMSTRKAFHEFESVSDDLGGWVERNFIFVADGSFPVEELRGSYNRYRTNNRRPPLSDSQFGREISQRFPKLKRVRIDNPRRWHYQGIRGGAKYSRMGSDRASVSP